VGEAAAQVSQDTSQRTAELVHDDQFMIPIGALVLSLVFWALDFRNRDLFRTCQEAAAHLESSSGVYTCLVATRDKTWISHGRAINVLVSAVSTVAWGLLYRSVFSGRFPNIITLMAVFAIQFVVMSILGKRAGKARSEAL
jgi:hypothetical protein